MTEKLEAIQYSEWGPWHAVRPGTTDDRTFCGRNPNNAKRMWETWDDKVDRCRACEKIAAVTCDD